MFKNTFLKLLYFIAGCLSWGVPQNQARFGLTGLLRTDNTDGLYHTAQYSRKVGK